MKQDIGVILLDLQNEIEGLLRRQNRRFVHFSSAMVFFTSMFEREIWRYPYARAYRATIAEAGHVCQTFLLTATSLGLASYCVMGIADSLIEADLGIDGLTESVLYCAGVARTPKGKGPATLPRGSVTMRPNKYLRLAKNRS